MSKQKVTFPQTIGALLLLSAFLFSLWWSFLGPGSEPPPHRLSAPFPGEEAMMKDRQKQAESKQAPQKKLSEKVR